MLNYEQANPDCAVPLFTTVPSWYVNIEIGLLIVALMFFAIGVVTRSAAILALCRAETIHDIKDELNDTLLSAKTITPLIMAAIILFSLYHQGMTTWFTVYLVAVIISNILRVTLIVKQNVLVNKAIAEMLKPVQRKE